KIILSIVILTSLNVVCLAVSESNVFFKLILLTCIDSLWLIIIYHTSIIRCVGISILFASFINIVDNFFFIAITAMIHINMQELYKDPYGYYLVCYVAKICEVIIFIIIGFFIKQKLYFIHVTWKHWLKTFILPIVSLFIAVFLWRLYWIVPFAADAILLCTI